MNRIVYGVVTCLIFVDAWIQDGVQKLISSKWFRTQISSSNKNILVFYAVIFAMACFVLPFAFDSLVELWTALIGTVTCIIGVRFFLIEGVKTLITPRYGAYDQYRCLLLAKAIVFAPIKILLAIGVVMWCVSGIGEFFLTLSFISFFVACYLDGCSDAPYMYENVIE